MQTIPKKKIVLLIISIIAVALIFALLAFMIIKGQTHYEEVPFGNLFIWKILAAVFSLYALVKP